MVKYQFAQDEQHNIVNIQELSRDSNIKLSQFFCLGCEHDMIPILGKKRVKHFRHKNIEINCQPETYLHKLAKSILHKVYTDCLNTSTPFYIEFSQNIECNYYKEKFSHICQIENVIEKFDLTQYFDKIKLEKREGEFIPDLVLYAKNNSSEKIFIEIAVTHFSSDLKKQSGIRIIEIRIDSEKDIFELSNTFLRESEKITFWNFKKNIETNWCSGNCSLGKNLVEENKLQSIAYNQLLKVYHECLLQQQRFLIQFNQSIECNHFNLPTCKLNPSKTSIDITKSFKDIQLLDNKKHQTKEIHLVDKENDIVIILCVQTKNLHAHVDWNSKVRRIILTINCHDDLLKIEKAKLVESDDVIFLNFKRNINKDLCSGFCSSDISKDFIYFEIRDDGSTYLRHGKEIFKNHISYSHDIVLTKRIPSIYIENFQLKSLYIHCNKSSYLSGFMVRNCFLCKYHKKESKYWRESQSVFCNKIKKDMLSNEAVNCHFYQVI